MFLMSTSIVLTVNSFTILNSGGCWRDRWRRKSRNLLVLSDISVGVISSRSRRRNQAGLIPSAKRNNHSSKKKSWWRNFFLEEDGNWLGLKEDDMVEDEEFENSSKQAEGAEENESEEDKFEAWKRRAEAIIELRETQDDLRNEENRSWEDWVVVSDETDSYVNGAGENWDVGNIMDEFKTKTGADVSEMMPERGLVETVRDFILGREDDDLLYEDRVFQYASRNSAKFLAAVIIIPWALDFIVHDYVLMPFLDRYVQTVPLAAEVLDVRRNQKLEMVKELKVEKARLRFEVEIGKSPPLSEEETWLELRHRALELRDEWRLENRKAFANIWSDIVFGIAVFFILYFNQSKVALLKFTGYKILNNISDTGKAILIILITDIFLGYHSESGWQTLCEIIVEHYGLQVDQSAITFFICLVPVIIDACVKLWMFKFLPRLSPKVANIFQEMKRH